MTQAVVFDCDGVLVENTSSWRNIHEQFGTIDEEGDRDLNDFLDGVISEEEFVERDIDKWKKVQPEIHRDDIMRCYSGVSLMNGAREVIEELRSRGIYVAIISSGVDLLVGTIARMLKVDDWAANGFEWDEDGWLVKGLPTVVYSHNKGIMVEKLIGINNFDSASVFCIGDSSTDLSMRVGDSQFIGFNPARNRAISAFEAAEVPIVIEKDLRRIWPILFPGEVLAH